MRLVCRRGDRPREGCPGHVWAPTSRSGLPPPGLVAGSLSALLGPHPHAGAQEARAEGRGVWGQMVGTEARLRMCPPWPWLPVGAAQGAAILSFEHGQGKEEAVWELGQQGGCRARSSLSFQLSSLLTPCGVTLLWLPVAREGPVPWLGISPSASLPQHTRCPVSRQASPCSEAAPPGRRLSRASSSVLLWPTVSGGPPPGPLGPTPC